jgi:uncharacterized protein with PIN domain
MSRQTAVVEELPSFIADSMLGRLARWLRILGCDTWYFRDISDADLIGLHRASGRLLLTRDTRLIRSPGIGAHLLVQEDHWENQLKQVLDRLDLPIPEDKIMTRCLVCNHPLRKRSIEEVRGKVPDYVLSTRTEFHGCDRCRKTYWEGTHRANILRVIHGLPRRGQGQEAPLP